MVQFVKSNPLVPTFERAHGPETLLDIAPLKKIMITSLAVLQEA